MMAVWPYGTHTHGSMAHSVINMAVQHILSFTWQYGHTHGGTAHSVIHMAARHIVSFTWQYGHTHGSTAHSVACGMWHVTCAPSLSYG